MIKILILGGGFGGVATALSLEKRFRKNPKHKVEITLIDKNGYHLFTPDIYEVASVYGLKKDLFAVQLKRTICLPYADIFGGKEINFIQAEITEVNLKNQNVRTGGGHTLNYDYLVFSLGGEATDFNVPGVKDYAHQFKTLDDAIFINQKLEELSEEFKTGQRTQPFSFLICGAGFTGIELAAELSCCSKVIKDRCKLRGRCSTITLFEAGPKILPTVSEKERRLFKERLTKLGIIIMENSAIEEVGDDSVKLTSGQKIQGNLVIWTTGIKPSRLIAPTEGLPLSASGKIVVEKNLQVKGHENIFGVGDNADFTDPITQRSVPGLGYVAAAQGKVAGKNIFNAINSKSLDQYKPRYDMWITPAGGKYAIAHYRGRLIANGFLGWIVRQFADIRYLLSIFSLNKALEVYWNEVTIFSKND